MRTLILIAALITAPVMLSACNTVDGIGQDLERAGEEVQSW